MPPPVPESEFGACHRRYRRVTGCKGELCRIVGVCSRIISSFRLGNSDERARLVNSRLAETILFACAGVKSGLCGAITHTSPAKATITIPATVAKAISSPRNLRRTISSIVVQNRRNASRQYQNAQAGYNPHSQRSDPFSLFGFEFTIEQIQDHIDLHNARGFVLGSASEFSAGDFNGTWSKMEIEDSSWPSALK